MCESGVACDDLFQSKVPVDNPLTELRCAENIHFQQNVLHFGKVICYFQYLGLDRSTKSDLQVLIAIIKVRYLLKATKTVIDIHLMA